MDCASSPTPYGYQSNGYYDDGSIAERHGGLQGVHHRLEENYYDLDALEPVQHDVVQPSMPLTDETPADQLLRFRYRRIGWEWDGGQRHRRELGRKWKQKR